MKRRQSPAFRTSTRGLARNSGFDLLSLTIPLASRHIFVDIPGGGGARGGRNFGFAPGAGQSADIACLVSRCDWHFGVARQCGNPRDNVTSRTLTYVPPQFRAQHLHRSNTENEARARAQTTKPTLNTLYACSKYACIEQCTKCLRGYETTLHPLTMNALWVISSQ